MEEGYGLSSMKRQSPQKLLPHLLHKPNAGTSGWLGQGGTVSSKRDGTRIVALQ